MFEHLDDPHPYTPPAGLRTAVRARARRRHQRRLAVAGGVASIAALGVGAVTTTRARLEPQQVDVGGLATEPSSSEPETLVAEPADRDDEPTTFLVVGVDETGVHTDTMALVRLDPVAGELRLLSIPRDLVLDGQRANSLVSTGGPERLIRTLTEQLGVPINHYVQVDFAGAVALTDAIGGIRVAVDRPIRNEPTGTELAAGCQALDGEAALGLGRARHVEVQQDDGSWVDVGSSATGRDARSAAVAAALLQAAGRVGLDDLPALVATGLDWVTVDDSLSGDDLVAWARQARDDRYLPFALPVVPTTLGEAEALALDVGADRVVAAFRDGGERPIPLEVEGGTIPDPTGLRPC